MCLDFNDNFGVDDEVGSVATNQVTTKHHLKSDLTINMQSCSTEQYGQGPNTPLPGSRAPARYELNKTPPGWHQ
jgi:hypothetical protein